MRKKIGLLGGSFDPIHIGHLHLALTAQEHAGLDEVLFCPAATSPYRVDNPSRAIIDHRLAMVRLALEDFPTFSLCDLEAKRGGISYTIDTLKELGDSNDYFLVMGSDVRKGLLGWKESKKILELAPPIVISRNGDEGIKTPKLEVSSTWVRERLSKSLSCAHLLPAKVLDYIGQNRLY
ncbi:MAG: nicotinate (nicotinamide) nucleotide adenylyltransferase [Simkaniaceae bacterium]|nr:nicotinate (nicotinamide) nucleotide adenylyltransferase [Simkaniaceae bacterium]